MEPIKVGLLGFGTVGSGTFTVLRRNQEEIKRRAGRGIEIARVAVRTPSKAQARRGRRHVAVTDDFNAVVDDPSIDIVCEMIGGTGVARELVLRAIANGKHVVTANKALLAVHGSEIFEAARAKGVMVAFEAAVAGGIPIIKALREGLTANRIQYIAGIINGTTNYILSEMRDRGLDFATALKAAQELGYAEADPTFDIEGVDAAHKVTIMSAIAFGVPVQFDRAYVEGISKLVGHRHPLCRGTRLSHQAARHRAAHGEGHRTAHASDADSGKAPAGERRRRDERGRRAWRRGRHDALLRQGRGRRADGVRRGRRSGRRDAPAYGRPRASRAASRVPAGQPLQHADPADRRSDERLLPAPARGGRDRRARQHHAHSRRQGHLDRRVAAEGIGAGRRRSTRAKPTSS